MSNLQGSARGPRLDNTRFDIGSPLSFLLTGTETDGRPAVVVGTMKPGNEPPPHVHRSEANPSSSSGEHGQSIVANGSNVVILPLGKAHAFCVCSERFRALLTVRAADDHNVGLDVYLRETSEPATSMNSSQGTITNARADLQRAIPVGARHGMEFLTPGETKRRRPKYPGFSAGLAC